MAPVLTTVRSLPRLLLTESGLLSVSAAGRDAALIILSRSCRMFAYGASSLILALFFAELGFSDKRIGAFMTLTLLGDVVLSLVLTLVADRVGRRRTMLLGSAMMVLTGTVFALSQNYWYLLGAAVVGVLSTNGGDFGPIRAVEESALSELTFGHARSDVLSWYVTLASLGSAVGMEVSGRILEALNSKQGWTLLDAYHSVFWLYAIFGVVNIACTAFLSERCELKTKEDRLQEEETASLLAGGDELGRTEEEPKPRTAWMAQISRESLSVVAILWALLMVDSLADGMSTISFTTYYMDEKFQLPKAALGDTVSASYFLGALSTVFAGPLSRYIGLVNTMVFTHIPSSAAVLLFPLAQTVPLTVTLLLVRIGLNNMDQSPRATLLSALVRPEERTAVLGITTVLRTLAATTGPTITGILAGNDRFWIAFVVAGALRLAYDCGLFLMFINISLHKHEPTEDGAGAVERGSDEFNAPPGEP